MEASVTAELPVNSIGRERAMAFAINIRIATGEFSRYRDIFVGLAVNE